MKQVFRSTFAVVVGWAWMVFAALNAIDLVIRYSGRSSMIAAAVLAVLTALVFLTCLRPAVVASEEGVLVRNPLRNTFVPWRAVDEVTVSHSIKITSGGRSVRCWVPQTSARERAAAVRRGRTPDTRGGLGATEPVRSKGEQAAAAALAGRTHADWVAQQITERAAAARRAAALRGADEATTPAEATTPDEATTSTEATTPGGDGAGVPEETFRTSWAPTALAALAAAAVPTIAAFLV
ncbi:PH domain-containing protein [Streptosporangium sp. NPDC023615]|uniref:PH domain-containing protein n=1 Tax=Streptosporangium sp. NPDC023615 TaxID=3154794 RepID=UPI00341C7484